MDELTNTSETTPDAATNPTAPEPSSLESFKQLLESESAGDGSQESGDGPEGSAADGQQNATPTDGEPDGKPKGKPKALKDLADGLGVALEDLYSVEVPLGDGKSMTLGDLKHAAQKQDDLSVRELQLEERRAQLEAEITQERADLESLVKLLDPKAITPKFVEEVKQRASDEAKREMKATLELIPEWQNADLREKELAGMVDYLKGFGIPPTFLSAMPNHKLFRLVRDAWQRKARVDAALAKVTPVKRETTAGKSRPNGKAPAKPNATPTVTNSGDMRSRFRAILQAEG